MPVSPLMQRRRFLAGIVKCGLCISLILGTAVVFAQDPGNGIHVGDAKVYDARELTLMLDSLNRALQGKNFIDQRKLAAALGNVQGFQGTDTSTAFFANGAVGPQAAAVFAGNLPASISSAASTPSAAAPAMSSTAPSVSININPAASPTTSASPTGLGPSTPTLPTLQTAPTYNPSYGPSGNDLLTDEVSLSYQIVNLSMLLNRSLTDQIYGDGSRLQAVVGFDIDIEPDDKAKDAVAVVEITASMKNCPEAQPAPSNCVTSVKPEVVAMMPEQGSHNVATLSQSAHAFGGALAAQVFSVGVAGQKRSQTFYLYRDIDTVSFQEPDLNPNPDSTTKLHFGWQFRPVLGRHTVEAGLRHMMVVLSLPASDSGDPRAASPSLSIHVRTHWIRYESKTQTTTTHEGFFESLFGGHVPQRVQQYDQKELPVPRTNSYQQALEPKIDYVQWVPTDNANGVAIIRGSNFFLGTTIRVGNKTYTGNNDGLTLKSDKEIEISLPLSAAVGGGVLSGRYGNGQLLESKNSDQYARRLDWEGADVFPEGPDAVQVIARLIVYPPGVEGKPTISCASGPNGSFPVDQNGNPIPVDKDGIPQNLADLPQVKPTEFERAINRPGLLLNGSPIATPTWLVWNPIGNFKRCEYGYPPGSNLLNVQAVVPAKDMKGSTVVSVVFPFEGVDWIKSGISYEPALNIARAGSKDIAKLIIDSTNPGDLLCDGHWSVELDQCEVAITRDPTIPVCKPWSKNAKEDESTKGKRRGEEKKASTEKEAAPIPQVLSCADSGQRKLGLDIAAGQIKNYKRLVLVHRGDHGVDKSRIGTIPDAKYKPPAPKITKGPEPASVQQYSSRTIELDGTDLDQIKKVLFDKTELKIVNQDAESLIISIPRSMTQKPASHDQIQLISDQNDPVLINLDVTANPAAPKKEK